MYNLIKISENEYEFSNEKNLVVGKGFLNNNVPVNKITIEINENHRGKGYGKELLKEMIKEYKKNSNESQLRFEVYEKNTITNIIEDFGGLNKSNQDGISTYILPIQNI